MSSLPGQPAPSAGAAGCSSWFRGRGEGPGLGGKAIQRQSILRQYGRFAEIVRKGGESWGGGPERRAGDVEVDQEARWGVVVSQVPKGEAPGATSFCGGTQLCSHGSRAIRRLTKLLLKHGP